MDFEEAKTYTANGVTTLKDCADMTIYRFGRMHPAGAIFVGIGLFIKNLIVSSAPDQVEPVLANLREMKRLLKRLSHDMGNHFNDLKAFSVAKDFYNNYALKSSVLAKLVGGTMEAKSDKDHKTSIAVFKSAYKLSPLSLAIELRKSMDHEVTNPIKMAMSGDKWKTKKTFDDWNDAISAVFSELYFIESVASGLFHGGDTYRQDQITEEHEQFKSMVEEWRNEYLSRTPGCWPNDVRHLVEDTQDNHWQKTNAEKAEIIRDQLDKILTNDTFIVIVSNSNFLHSTVGHPNTHISSENRAGSHALVFRSPNGKFHLEEVEQFRKDLQKYNVLTHDTDLHWFKWAEVKGWSEELKNCAFMECIRVSSFDDRDHVGIRSTSSDLGYQGPGGYIHGKLFHFDDPLSSYEYFFLIAGYN